jgi:hypothetical protein
MRIFRVIKAFGLVFGLVLLIGCGARTGQNCSFGALSVSPPTGSADHSALSPGNSQQFLAFGTNLPAGCMSTQSNLLNVTWSLSDVANAKISNSQDATFGVATYTNVAPTAITVTATLDASHNSGKTVTGTALLMCK